MKLTVHGKLLLFGEYAILHGGDALSIPHKDLHGRLQLHANEIDEIKSHEAICSFYNYLKLHFDSYFELNRFEKDLNNKLFFNSNIPQGYGAGSSGALLAAILHLYGRNLPNELDAKKRLFGKMEGFFHGKSSGLDVLVCYENQGILLKDGLLSYCQIDDNKLLSNFSTIDNQCIGITSELVATFKSQSTEFEEQFKQIYLKASNACISAFLQQDEELLIHNLKIISEFTITKMPFTIPSASQNAWKNSLNHNSSIHKLCGSGGGGFTLVYKVY